MANRFYTKAKEGFLDGRISWTKDKIRVALVDFDVYEPSLETDRYFMDLVGVLAVSNPLEEKTIVDGFAGAAPALFPKVPTNPVQKGGLVIYQDLGVQESHLIVLIREAKGLPVFHPNGGDVLFAWSSHLFKL